MIDKVEFRLAQPLDGPTLRGRLLSAGLRWKKTRLKDRREYLMVTDGDLDLGWRIRFGPYRSENFSYVLSNPARHRDFNEYLSWASKMFSRNDLESAALKIVHLAVDIPDPLDEVMAGLHILWKQSDATYMRKHGRVTGMRVGQKPEVFSVYDKAFREKEDTPRTRIEVQLTGGTKGRLPCTRIHELPELLERYDNFVHQTPFSKLALFRIGINQLPGGSSENLIRRHERFITLLRDRGFQYARRALNKDGNFKRDFGKFYTQVPHEIVPMDALKDWFTMYFHTWSWPWR